MNRDMSFLQMYAWSVASSQSEYGPLDYQLKPGLVLHPPFDMDLNRVRVQLDCVVTDQHVAHMHVFASVHGAARCARVRIQLAGKLGVSHHLSRKKVAAADNSVPGSTLQRRLAPAPRLRAAQQASAAQALCSCCSAFARPFAGHPTLRSSC